MIQAYLRAGEEVKAINLARSCLRSIESLKKASDLFDDYKKRSLAIQMENFCEEEQKEQEYEQMQIFNFVRVREEAEKVVKPKSYDPMRRGSRKNAEKIPSFSQSVQTI